MPSQLLVGNSCSRSKVSKLSVETDIFITVDISLLLMPLLYCILYSPSDLIPTIAKSASTSDTNDPSGEVIYFEAGKSRLHELPSKNNKVKYFLVTNQSHTFCLVMCLTPNDVCLFQVRIGKKKVQLEQLQQLEKKIYLSHKITGLLDAMYGEDLYKYSVKVKAVKRITDDDISAMIGMYAPSPTLFLNC